MVQSLRASCGTVSLSKGLEQLWGNSDEPLLDAVRREVANYGLMATCMLSIGYQTYDLRLPEPMGP